MPSKNIVIIEPCGKRGIVQYTHLMSNELARQGHQVLLVTAIDYETKSEIKNYGVLEVFDRFIPHPLRLFDALSKIRRLKPDVIHLQGALHPGFYYILILMLKCVSSAKLFYTAHEIFMGGKKKHSFFIGFFLRRLFSLVDSIIVHADSAKNDIVRVFNVAASDVHTLPLGTNLISSSFAPDKAGLNISNQDSGNLQILFFGIIEPKKGLIYLIRAFAKVVKEIKNVKLVIAGEPFEDIAHYVEEIQRLHIEDSVKCIFQYIALEDVPSYFMSADIIVAPYTHACQSGIIATAFNFSKPVISSDCGGLSELVQHGERGLVVSVGDVEELATAMLILLKDAELRETLGRNAGRVAKEKYSWENIVGEMDAIYDE